MSFKGKHLITCQDWTVEELNTVFALSKTLKHKFKVGEPHELLKNKTFFMIFYATSTRTRNSFEAAMTQLGGHAHYLETKTMRLGDPGAAEAIKDTIKVLERYGQGVGVRVYTPNYGEGEQIIREYARWSKIPVISMESDAHHPCQALADMLTIKEKIPKYEGKKYVQAWAYSPNALRVPAVPQSDIMMVTRYGMDVVYVRPKEFTLDPKITEQAERNAEESGGSFNETDDLKEAMDGAHVVNMRNHTTLKYGEWGAKTEQEIMDKYGQWTYNQEWLDLTDKKSIFMHCLPVDRDHEVTSEVLDGPHSVVFDEAENRLHVQKAILALTMA
ncbi:MAG: ornithine carbamoyltransferase [Candidatus Geothermarchaeales archaeon]